MIPIEGNDTLPSVISILPDGEVLVGKPARNRQIVDPSNTVSSVKRVMGEEKTWEFTGKPDKPYTPQDIAAEILGKLKSGAEQSENFDLRGTPRYVVLCIPANFDDLQKKATLEAAELANLEVIKLLEEPVAAAIAYAMEKEQDQTILVYDLGGGTFDVSLLKVDSTQDGRSSFKILAKEGVSKLGGDDFDQKIMEIAGLRFKETSGIDIFDLEKDQGINTKSLREAQQKLKQASETAKCELTEAEIAQISLPNLLKDESGQLHNLETEITRSEFNDAIRPLLLHSQEAIEKALENAHLTIEDISRLILVGGSTRIPLVSEILKEIFQREPYKDTNPDTVVARGAALFAATLTVPNDPENQQQLEEVFVIENTVTYFLGIESQGGRFSCLLNKGQEIPVDHPLSVSKEFTNPMDNMTEIPIRVYQSSERSEWVRSGDCRWIGEFSVKIPPKPRGQERITVTFSLDQQNLLKIEAISSTEGKALEINRY